MNLEEFQQAFSKLLGPTLQELEEVFGDLAKEVQQRRYIIELPESLIVDLPVENLADLVAKTSNAYGRIARFAGQCRAEYDLASGAYKRSYETNQVGKNDSERRANAMRASEEAHIRMTTAEAAYHYSEKLENAARIASESARKIYDKVNSMFVAQGREEHGTHADKDIIYTSYNGDF